MNLRPAVALTVVIMVIGILPAGAVPADAAPTDTAPQVVRPALEARAVAIMTGSMRSFQRQDDAARGPYDWTDNACSRVPDGRFAEACDRHDFGYRNFGKGLRIDRTESRRQWIDDRFRDDMYEACEGAPGPDVLCRRIADVYHRGVRLGGASAFFG